MWLLRKKNQRGTLFFYHSTEAKPGGQRHFAHQPVRKTAQINYQEPEAATLQQHVSSFEGLFHRFEFGVVSATTHPQQPGEIHACNLGGRWIKRVIGIYQGTEMFLR